MLPLAPWVGEAEIDRVVDKFIAELRAQLSDKRVEIELTAAGRAWLARKGFDRSNGARPMARLIAKSIKEPLASALLFGELQAGGHARIDAANDELKLELTPLEDKTVAADKLRTNNANVREASDAN